MAAYDEIRVAGMLPFEVLRDFESLVPTRRLSRPCCTGRCPTRQHWQPS